MKTALTIGCGSGNGKVIVDTLIEKQYSVINIGSQEHPDCQNIKIDWKELQITNLHQFVKFKNQHIDFVFFNQNASALEIESLYPTDDTLKVWRLIKDWQNSHWISCQMPVLLLHYIRDNLTPESKIGWMLSSMMCYDRSDVEKYPDYSSQKYFNFLAMKCFSKHYQTFGIMPNFSRPESQKELQQIITEVCDSTVDQSLFRMQ